ncbi:hypothetical protein QR680_006115 [Steinernema hermaphroditum]|uniref:CAAX prenyl protease 2 n=1 Tax=Steinernema hermaphroditum TaxID=289476 RepID=A0AA39HUC4_9BILA|nr:hypothetical protein QR680_006115 [Steinernema hermaphroditum]
MESVATVTASVLIPVGYVGFIHMFDYNGVDRDHPASLRKRFCAAFLHNALSIGTSYGLLRHLSEPFHTMGFHLHGTLAAVVGSSLLTGVFYLGNCLEKLYDEFHYPYGIGLFSLKSWTQSFRELTFIRNTFMAPITEEIAFRACSATLFYRCFGWNGAIFVAPLFFSLSHLHHIFDDMRKGMSKGQAIGQRVFQATYSYLFGVYATFIFMRTNHILVPIISHSICNNLGLPNFSFSSLNKKWTWAVTAGHVIGALSWVSLLYPLTSRHLYLSY